MIDKTSVRKGIAVAVIGVAITALIMMVTDFRDVWSVLVTVDWKHGVAILALIPLNFCIKFWRYDYYLRIAGWDIRFFDKVQSLFSSFVMVITPAKLGEMLLRGYMLKNRGYSVPMAAVFSMTLADRLTEGIAMAFLSALFASSVSAKISVWPCMIVCLLIACFCLVFRWKNAVITALGMLGALGPRMKKVSDTCISAYQQSYEIFSFRAIVVSTLMGVLSWCCEGGVVYLAVKALGDTLTYAQSAFAVSFSGILGAVSMIPGGVGIADGTTLGVLLMCGVDKAVAGAVTIVSRFSIMWLGVVIGGITLLASRGQWLK